MGYLRHSISLSGRRTKNLNGEKRYKSVKERHKVRHCKTFTFATGKYISLTILAKSTSRPTRPSFCTAHALKISLIHKPNYHELKANQHLQYELPETISSQPPLLWCLEDLFLFSLRPVSIGSILCFSQLMINLETRDKHIGFINTKVS
jgi:hypothetical protein